MQHNYFIAWPRIMKIGQIDVLFSVTGHVQRESKVENESRKRSNSRGRFKITNDDYALQ